MKKKFRLEIKFKKNSTILSYAPLLKIYIYTKISKLKFSFTCRFLSSIMRVIWIFFRPIFSHLSFLIFQIFNSKLIFFNTLMHRTQLLLFQLLVQGLQLKFSTRSKRKHKLENLSSISLQIMKMLYKFQTCFYAAHRQPY